MKKEHAARAPMSKKKKIVLSVVLILVAVVALTALITVLVNRSRVTTLINQQNYVASKLIEMGSYEDGRQLAMKSEQARANDTSRTLIVLAAGFSADYSGGIKAADAYLRDGAVPLITETKTILASVLETYGLTDETETGGYMSDSVSIPLDDETRDALLAVLLKVQNSIRVKKTTAAVQAMQEMLATGTIQTVSQEMLESDNSLLSHKVQTLSAISRGEYGSAYTHAEALFSADNSFENRAMLANLVATGNVATDGDERAIEEQQRELQALYTELDSAYNAYYTMIETSYDENKQKTMYDEILRIEDEIASVMAGHTREVVKRAINFIEAGTPASQKNTAAYDLELAYLYYSAGNDERAADLLSDRLTDTETTANDAVSTTLSDIVTHYRTSSGGAGRSEERRAMWNRIAGILGIIETGYGDDTYFDFIDSVLNQIYKSLVIRSIDASDFPTVRVTVNASTDEGGNLKKKDFAITDMMSSVGGIRLVDASELEVDSDMSVMLVVDRSGSMDGLPMEHTKTAVMNFVKNTDDSAQLGLVTFESTAQLITPLGAGRTQLMSAVDAIYTSGGTNIKDGLAVAGEALGGTLGRRVIILISDGSDGSPDGIDAVLETLRMQNICVYTIAFGGADTQYLSYIADATGGKFLQSDSSAGLSEIYSEIGEYMVNDYVLEFEAVSELKDFSRELTVELEDAHAVAESTYHVGVPYQNILDEASLTPAYNAYRQIGGSASSH